MASLIATQLLVIKNPLSKFGYLYLNCFKLSSKNTYSFAALRQPIYSTLAVEVATVGWRLPA